MKQSLKITKYIVDILRNNSEVVGRVAFRIFPIDAKLGTTFPFIVVNRTSLVASYTKDGNSYDTINVDISIADPDYDEAVEIAGYVREALEQHRFKNDEISIRDIRLVGANESIQFDAVVEALQFEIKV